MEACPLESTPNCTELLSKIWILYGSSDRSNPLTITAPLLYHTDFVSKNTLFPENHPFHENLKFGVAEPFLTSMGNLLLVI